MIHLFWVRTLITEYMNGIFAVRKPAGPTSQDVVGKLKHIFTKSPEYKAEQKGQKGGSRRRQKFIKIGHGGTLDPLADGVLVIGVGSGTKQLANYLGQCSKVYTARALLGASTTTYDSQGSVLEYGKVDPQSVSDQQIAMALSQFRGKISQLPPVFSALKMDGRPLYEYAREGIPLPRAIEPRECEVSHLDFISSEGPSDLLQKTATEAERKFAEQVTSKTCTLSPITGHTSGKSVNLTFSVSSGTYIRTLIHDIGDSLGTKAYMTSLTRDSQGEWALGKNVLPLDLFDKEHDVWWPVLETVLREGPKRKIEEANSEANSESRAPSEAPHQSDS